MLRQKISIGLPHYGGFSGVWATQMLQFTAALAQSHTIVEVIASGVMTADHNRNLIVQEFLKSDAEWLFWIDSDTIVPVGAVERMLSHGRTLVSGLYYGKNDPHPPIAYMTYNGAFRPIDKEIRWEKGEIIEVDATGMGAMLTHRSVFEDILKNYTVFQVEGGGLWPVHNNDILGEPFQNGQPNSHEHDGKVYRGQLRSRLIPLTIANAKFPFFMVEHIRTEDMFFFDLAKRVGHTPVLDTSVECTHLRFEGIGGKEYREKYGH